MKIIILIVGVFALIVSGNAHVMKRSAGDVSALFQDGNVYNYDVGVSAGVGSHGYVHFANQANFTYKMDVAAQGTELHVHATDIKVGFFNGEFDNSHAPQTTFRSDLKILETPFILIMNENGLIEKIILDSNLPIWAQNFQRNIGEKLQIDFNHVRVSQSRSVNEKTTTGNCASLYTTSEDGVVREVEKYGAHCDCAEYDCSAGGPEENFHCPSDISRVLSNSKRSSVYTLKEMNGVEAAVKITSYDAAAYDVFSPKGYTQYSYYYQEFSLKSVKSGVANMAPISNPQTFPDIKYRYDPSSTKGQYLSLPQPYFLKAVSPVDQDSLTTSLVKNVEELSNLELSNIFDHTTSSIKMSRFNAIPIVALMDYENLMQSWNNFKDRSEIQRNLFLDSLVIAGTVPAALVIRDVAKITEDTQQFARIIKPFPNFVRDPNEETLQAFESLLISTNNPENRKVAVYAFAILLNRVCRNSGCQSSGYLNTYINSWKQDFEDATDVEKKIVYVTALFKVNVQEAAMRLMEVLNDKTEKDSVRSTVLDGSHLLVKTLGSSYVNSMSNILSNRNENTNLRKLAAYHLLEDTDSQNIFTQVVASVLPDINDELRGYVRTQLQSIADSQEECLQEKAMWAKAALLLLPDANIFA